MDKTQLHDRIEKLLEILNRGLYEKETALRLGLLAAIAGESIFFLGKPGCAKSMISRRIKDAFKSDGNNGIKYFEYLMNRFSTPEDIFGQYSLKALNGEGDSGKEEYKRLTEGFLPTSDIAFLDEIWKASPAIQNTLLTIINERIFHNGNKVDHVPLKALFAASNELPAKNSGLEALYDRFILRLPVNFIEDEENFFDMIDGNNYDFVISDEEKKYLISNEELELWTKEISKVTLSESAKNVISEIRKELVLQNKKMSDEDIASGELFEIGDRRWKKIAYVLKTSAFLNGRDEVDLMDCSLIEYCIWGTEKQQKKAGEIVAKCIKENGLDCASEIDDIEEQIREYTVRIDKDWFTYSKPKEYTMNDGSIAYRFLNPPQNVFFEKKPTKPQYISKDYKWPGFSDRQGMLFDANKNKLGDDSTFAFSVCRVNHDEISWTDWWRNNNKVPRDNYAFKIEIHTCKCNELKDLSDIAHARQQNNFDKENYNPIKQKIEEQINDIKMLKVRNEIHYKENLFANQNYNKSIMGKIDDLISRLEDQKVKLEKQHNRYFKEKLNPSLSLGDVILNDDRIFTQADIAKLSDKEKKNIIAVFCIFWEKIYAVGLKQTKGKWDTIKQFADSYGENLSQKFSKGWIVPNKNLLNEIWKNRDIVNASLKAINYNIDTFSSEEYWSSSENGESAAFFQLFGKNGKQDDTTKSHEYKVCVIRELEKI